MKTNTTASKKIIRRRSAHERIAEIAAKRIADLESKRARLFARHIEPLDEEILELRTMQTHVGVPTTGWTDTVVVRASDLGTDEA